PAEVRDATVVAVTVVVFARRCRAPGAGPVLGNEAGHVRERLERGLAVRAGDLTGLCRGDLLEVATGSAEFDTRRVVIPVPLVARPVQPGPLDRAGQRQLGRARPVPPAVPAGQRIPAAAAERGAGGRDRVLPGGREPSPEAGGADAHL